MKLELISVVSTDSLELPGLLYTPESSTKKAAVWLHGMGDSGIFYNPMRTNALAGALARHNIALLAFNNRGAHNSKTIRIIDETLPDDDRGYQGGTHYELIADCVADVNGAADFLQQRGFKELYLLGHSTGANKICAYHVRANENPFSKYVLAGPGDDSGIFFSELGQKKFTQALAYARNSIKKGKPFAILPKYTGMNPFSAQAAADILDPDGDYNTFPFYEETTKRLGKKPLFKEYIGINLPTLVIFGDVDEYAFTAGNTQRALEIFKKYTNPEIRSRCDYELVKNSDHSFHGAEQQFAQQVAQWLA